MESTALATGIWDKLLRPRGRCDSCRSSDFTLDLRDSDSFASNPTKATEGQSSRLNEPQQAKVPLDYH